MLIFWVMGDPIQVAQWPNGGIANKGRIEGDEPTLNLHFYGPKYHSSDALPAPEIFSLFYLKEESFSSNKKKKKKKKKEKRKTSFFDHNHVYVALFINFELLKYTFKLEQKTA